MNKKYFLMLAGLILLLYGRTVSFDLTEYDDITILQNIRSSMHQPQFIQKIFTTDAYLGEMNPLYRPLQTLSYYIEILIAGDNAIWLHHLTNTGIFILIVCLVFIFLKNFEISATNAFYLSLLMALHPVMVTAVAWIPARGDLLLTAFSLAAFIAFQQYVNQRRWYHEIFISLFFLLALFSKETAAFIPFVFLFYLLIRKVKIRIDGRLAVLFLLNLGIGIAWFLLKSGAVNVSESNEYSFRFSEVIVNFLLIPVSFSQYFFPLEMATLPRITLFKIISGLLVSGLLFFTYKRNKQKLSNPVFFGLIWFLMFLIPSFFIKHKFIDYLDHRFLLPFPGFLLMLYFIFFHQWKTVTFRNFTFALAIVFAAVSFIKADGYKNPASYVDYTLQYKGRVEVAYVQRGIKKHQAGNMQGAISDYTKAIKIFPDYATAYNDRGSVKFALKDYQGALQDFNQALRADNHYANSYENRAKAYYLLGYFNEAIADYENAIRNNLQKTPDFFYSRAMAKYALNQFQPAVYDLDSCIAMDKKYTQAYYDRAMALLNLKNYPEAMKNLDESIRLNPLFYDAYYIRSANRLYLSDFKGALDDCNFILQKYKDEPHALELKGKILKAMQ